MVPPFEHASHILVVGAHPDDPDYACGGSVARWVAEGRRVDYIVVTSGEKGRPDPDYSIQDFISVREFEQRASATHLGVSEVIFLGWPDGELRPDPDLRGDLVREIRRLRPELVVTHDPLTHRYRQHSDHRVVGQAVIDAIYPASRLGSFYPEHLATGLRPHTVHHVLLFASDTPDVRIDITDTVERKLEALRLHQSQASSFTGGLEYKVRLRATEAAVGTVVLYCEAFKYADLD